MDRIKNLPYTEFNIFDYKYASKSMALASWYKSFSELCRSEREGVSYQRKVANRQSRFAIIAPHGGRIEPGTSEITKAIAGTQFSYYTFDGIRQEGNELLHITSKIGRASCRERV